MAQFSDVTCDVPGDAARRIRLLTLNMGFDIKNTTVLSSPCKALCVHHYILNTIELWSTGYSKNISDLKKKLNPPSPSAANFVILLKAATYISKKLFMHGAALVQS